MFAKVFNVREKFGAERFITGALEEVMERCVFTATSLRDGLPLEVVWGLNTFHKFQTNFITLYQQLFGFPGFGVSKLTFYCLQIMLSYMFGLPFFGIGLP